MIIILLMFYSIAITSIFIWFWIRTKLAPAPFRYNEEKQAFELINESNCSVSGHVHFINPDDDLEMVVYELVELPDAICHWEADK